jgi:hypothetical protein
MVVPLVMNIAGWGNGDILILRLLYCHQLSICVHLEHVQGPIQRLE